MARALRPLSFIGVNLENTDRRFLSLGSTIMLNLEALLWNLTDCYSIETKQIVTASFYVKSKIIIYLSRDIQSLLTQFKKWIFKDVGWFIEYVYIIIFLLYMYECSQVWYVLYLIPALSTSPQLFITANCYFIIVLTQGSWPLTSPHPLSSHLLFFHLFSCSFLLLFSLSLSLCVCLSVSMSVCLCPSIRMQFRLFSTLLSTYYLKTDLSLNPRLAGLGGLAVQQGPPAYLPSTGVLRVSCRSLLPLPCLGAEVRPRPSCTYELLWTQSSPQCLGSYYLNTDTEFSSCLVFVLESLFN